MTIYPSRKAQLRREDRYVSLETVVRFLTFAVRLPAIGLSILLATPALATAQPRYVGIENCKLCHMPHYESWSATKMAKAFELLRPGVRPEAKTAAGLDPQADYSRYAACLPCHVTGYAKPGGFVGVDQNPDMTNVQCEMCHGPGSVYLEMMLQKRGTYTLEDYRRVGGLRMPSAEDNVCTEQCHNTKSPFVGSGFEFNFEDRKAIGTHRHDLEYIYLPFDL
jgi:hypothetical protein